MFSKLLSDSKSLLSQSVSGDNLALFRVLFAALLLYNISELLASNFSLAFFGLPVINFPYSFATWAKPLTGQGMEYLLISLGGCLALVLVGVFVRPALILFGLGYSYLFLCEQALYNNHFYLIALLSILLATTNCDQSFNLVRFVGVKTPAPKSVPRWNYLILQAQILIVYFYGGLSKLNSDWLIAQQPMRSFLNNGVELGQYPQFLASEVSVFLFTYGGLLFDLLIGPLLIFKKTRPFAFAGLLFFNLVNSQIFDDISIFPYLMIASLLLFVKKSLLGGYLAKKSSSQNTLFRLRPIPIACFAVYFLLQLTLPLRHNLIPGNTDWTGEGQYFSWRMKIQDRSPKDISFFVKNLDLTQNNELELQLAKNGKAFNRPGLSMHIEQLNLIANKPHAAFYFAQFLQAHFKEEFKVNNIEVRAKILTAFNGRDVAAPIKSTVDLLSASYSSFRHNDWINQLE